MTESGTHLNWTDWRPLAGASRDRELPLSPGLYRIRRVGRTDLDYIGQTGAGLRQRLGMLRGVYGAEMPYADPHTAGPALWALRHATDCEFEVSVTPVEGSTSWRKGMEAVAIALYRQKNGRSPTVEFGRVPSGYLPSSMRSKRIRGGPSLELHRRHQPGIAPLGPLKGDPQDPNWGGHVWSDWLSLRVLSTRKSNLQQRAGLYRIRGDEQGTLIYVGQGVTRHRLLHHRRKIAKFDGEQGRIFAEQQTLDCSWTFNDAWLSHQRLELENDLIAAHILETGGVPSAQFLRRASLEH